MPYSVYPELDFDVPVGTGEVGSLGDCFDRYIVRMREMKESGKILRQCLEQIPEGPVIAKVPRNFKPPAGDAYVRVESAARRHGLVRGERRQRVPVSLRIRTGSFTAMSIIDKLSRA